ncbi:hypothetical protein PIROE2DRAFT_63603 [Piromyces sp. E2]|nr:hypothetical protein PIROE2DRAFT_63603 [Piromyces sp. E2]|eukprot:OUM59680.1 hypothetical protein PIROE2DRAFT_63603 [Piromyces sp. E2]
MGLYKNLFCLALLSLSLAEPIDNCSEYYKVGKNESILDIANKHKLPATALFYFNDNKLNEIKENQVICINKEVDMLKYLEVMVNHSELQELSKKEKSKVEKIINKKFNKDEIEELNQTSDFASLSFNKVFESNLFNKFDLNKCERGCSNAQKIFNEINKSEDNLLSVSTINNIAEDVNTDFKIKNNTLYQNCLDFCYTNNFIQQYREEKEEAEEFVEIESIPEKNKFEKRGCSGPSRKGTEKIGDLKVSRYYDNNELLKAGRIDGCSAPFEVLKIDIFKPACNAHYYCYHCSSSKSQCDSTLYSQLKTICKEKYLSLGFDNLFNGYKNYGTCMTEALGYYLAVVDFGEGGYNSDRGWVEGKNNSDCVCSNACISNFMNQPFYTEKDKV